MRMRCTAKEIYEAAAADAEEQPVNQQPPGESIPQEKDELGIPLYCLKCTEKS